MGRALVLRGSYTERISCVPDEHYETNFLRLSSFRPVPSVPARRALRWSRYLCWKVHRSGTRLIASFIFVVFTQPPVQVFGLEGRYASALYSAASKQKALEKVEKELIVFQQTVAKDERLSEFIKNPILKRSLKVDALASVAKKQNMTPLSANLLGNWFFKKCFVLDCLLTTCFAFRTDGRERQT